MNTSRINYNWQNTDKFEISGAQLQTLMDFANAFRGIASMVNTIDHLMVQQWLNGKVNAQYFDTDGNAISQEEMEEYKQELIKKVNAAVTKK